MLIIFSYKRSNRKWISERSSESSEESSVQSSGESASKSTSRSKSDHQLTLLCLSVSIMFIMLNLTNGILVLTFTMGSTVYIPSGPNRIIALVWAIADQLVYVNHAVNFLLYCLAGTKFRTEMTTMLRSWIGRN